MFAECCVSIFILFFFLMDKKQLVLIKKNTSKLPKSTLGSIQKGHRPEKGQKVLQNPPSPKNHLYPIHVRKSNKLLSLSALNTLDQDQKLQMKELFNLYVEKASL